MTSDSEKESDSETYNNFERIYKNDPLVAKSHVNKKVSIKTQDSKDLSGYVYCQDPVSESVMIISPEEDSNNSKIKIVMKHAIKSCEYASNEQLVLPNLFGVPERKYTDEEISKRKNLVLEILTESRFPVKDEKGILCIENTVSIEPPYRAENCVCVNSTILNRMQAILSSIP